MKIFAAQLPLLILLGGGGGGGQTAATAKLNCTHCSPTSTSYSLGGGVRLVTAKLNCTHCSPTSTSDSWGGSDCSHCKVELHSLQPDFHFLFVGVGGSDCSHYKVELHSLQPNFHFLFLGVGGGVGLQSLHNKMQSFQFCIFSIEMKYLMHSLLIKKYFQKQN